VGTYKEIQQDIKKRHGRAVKPCWIAHVKELNGLKPKVAHNRISREKRKYPCPPEIRPLIEESMQRLGVLPGGDRLG